MLLPLVGETDDSNSIHRPQTHDVPTSGGTFLLKTNSSQENVGTEDKDAPADAFFEMESGRSTLDTIEPIEDDKNTEFFTGDQPLLLKRTPTIFSTFSCGSVLSARSTREIFSLKDLCEKVIEKHLWLQMARIVSTSCYSQYRNLVLHRFLILQLRRPEKKDIWLRIDRRAGVSFLSLARKLGRTAAKDIAQLSASKEALIGTARQENIQEFDRPPFLADFSDYLRVICEELLEYRIWPENCWLFCSLLQEHLGGSGDGRYAFGRPIAPNTAPIVRERISERVVAQVTPNTIMTALQGSVWRVLSRRWQPLSDAMPRGWFAHSIAIFFAKIACPVQGLDISHTRDILERISGSLLAVQLEKNDLHSRIAIFCIDTLSRLPEENNLQLLNPLILNSDIPDLSFQILSKIPGDIQYAALHVLFHVVEIENSPTELFIRLEMFITESAIRWLEVLSLLGEVRNALIALERVIVWCETRSRQLQGQNLGTSLLQLLLQCHQFAHQYYGVISASAGHIAHSALSHSSDADWQRRYRKSSYEHLPTVQRQHSGCLHIISKHTDRVVSLSFSSDGFRVASASEDKTVRIWDSVTGEELNVLRGHTGWVSSVSISSDGSRIASASFDTTARIWDAVTGEELRVLRGHTNGLRSVSISSDGSRVASASDDKTARVWDAVTGEVLRVLRGHTNWVHSVSFSFDGSKVASASEDKTVRIWDAVTGEELKILRGHTDWVRSVSILSDGSKIASASNDRTVRIWDVVSGEELKVFRGHTDYVRSVSFSSDGSSVVSASNDRTIRIWDAVTGEELKVFRGHTDWVRSVSFSPDRSKVASASDDKTVRIWDGVIREAISVSNNSIPSNPHPSLSSNPITVPNECSFGKVKHDTVNRIHLFLGTCGTPHFIAPTHTSDIISTWEISPDGQALTIHMEDGNVQTIEAPKRYRCVQDPTS